MKLSRETIQIMKNFSIINGNLMLKEGNVLRTISAAKNVYAEAEIAETFDTDFGIYDCNEFLAALNAFEDADINFGEKYAVFTEGNNMSRYFAADPAVLTFPEKSINLPETDVSFEMDEKQISNMLKWTGIYRAPDVTFKSEDGDVYVEIGDAKNSASNTFTMKVGEADSDFNVLVKVEKLKMMPASYTVSLNKKVISFKGKTVHYIVSVDA